MVWKADYLFHATGRGCPESEIEEERVKRETQLIKIR